MTLANTSQVVLQSKTLKFTLNLTGTIGIQFGAPNSNGVAPVVIPQALVHFNPVTGVPGFAGACVTALTDGVGVIDCDGGSANLDLTETQDHNTNPGNANNSGPVTGLADDASCTNTSTWPDGTIDQACREGDACNPTGPHAGICNSPVVITQGGAFGPGALRVVQTVNISTVTSAGPDNTLCTADDTASAPAPVTVFFTTGTSSGKIVDANNTASSIIGTGATCTGSPCTAQATGVPFDCNALRNTGSFNGAAMVGTFLGLDGPAPLGDVVTTMKLVSQ